jgi:hypothetical protein
MTQIHELAARRPAHLMQYDRRSADALVASWADGADFEQPAVSRRTDAISLDDLIFFWVTGTAEKAGLIGVGVASGRLLSLEHPVSYRDQQGPRVLRDSAEVALYCVFDTPVVTRADLLADPAFADFDLFAMPNRPNAFRVTAEQAALLVQRVEAVLGR